MRKLLKRTERASRMEMITSLAVNDFKAAYVGSVLGFVWAIAEPLVTVLVYWFVYTVAFGGVAIDGVPYHIWLSVGISVWFFVSEGLKKTAAVYRDYSYLVKKMNFDKSVLPPVRVGSTLISHFVFLVIVCILCVAERRTINFAAMVISVVLAAAFVCALGRFLALLCGIYKDVQNITGVVLNMGFWLTPVFWNVDNAGSLIRVVYLNPVAVIVEAYRKAMLFGEFVDVKYIMYILLICGLLLLIGNRAEKKILPNIADGL